jgi:hypothetical protein
MSIPSEVQKVDTIPTSSVSLGLCLAKWQTYLIGPKADPGELNLWTMIPMSTTTRAMLDPEADEVDEQMDTDAHDDFH